MHFNIKDAFHAAIDTAKDVGSAIKDVGSDIAAPVVAMTQAAVSTLANQGISHSEPVEAGAKTGPAVAYHGPIPVGGGPAVAHISAAAPSGTAVGASPSASELANPDGHAASFNPYGPAPIAVQPPAAAVAAFAAARHNELVARQATDATPAAATDTAVIASKQAEAFGQAAGQAWAKADAAAAQAEALTHAAAAAPTDPALGQAAYAANKSAAVAKGEAKLLCEVATVAAADAVAASTQAQGMCQFLPDTDEGLATKALAATANKEALALAREIALLTGQ